MTDQNLPALSPDQRFMAIVDSLEQIENFCAKIAKSSIIPSRLKGKPEDIAVQILYGREMGMTPMQALNDIYVVNGVPSIPARVMLARIRKFKPDAWINWVEKTDTRVTLEMARDESKKGLYSSTWTLEMAKQRGLLNKDNWKNNPLMMLSWRCISECSRVVFPDVISAYDPDETEDMDNEYSVIQSKAEARERIKTTAIEVQNKFAQPEEVISVSSEEQISETAGNDKEAQIKSRVDNRDWKINQGSDKGKCLHEYRIDDLERRLAQLTAHWESVVAKNSKAKMPDDIKVLFANLSAYCAQYRKIEQEIELDESL